MITSLATLNATDMFTSVVVLSAVGVARVTLIRRVERRLLRWAPGQEREVALVRFGGEAGAER